jgi:hypothetical protein
MNKLKTYEGFFDFFKKSEDDKIAQAYLKRLSRIKDISPYEIEFTPNEEENRTNGYSIQKFIVKFDDTPITVAQVLSLRGGFLTDTKNVLLDRGFVRKNDSEFYKILVDCEGENEILKASSTIIKDIFNLCTEVYKRDKEARRIRKINLNINPAADELDPDIW